MSDSNGQTSRLQYVVGMDPDDPKRMDKIREYAAIYGRFDCKRKAEKPLTLHEVRGTRVYRTSAELL